MSRHEKRHAKNGQELELCLSAGRSGAYLGEGSDPIADQLVVRADRPNPVPSDRCRTPVNRPTAA